MINKGPIILIDDDEDECEIMDDVLKRQAISNKLLYFKRGADALTYLSETEDQPFIIFCDINMPLMNGMQLRQRIVEDDYLRNKSIPFIFYTTTASKHSISEAYKMSVQGFFQKETLFADIGTLVKSICNYWDVCHHPNRQFS